jgi:hypothetical protein
MKYFFILELSPPARIAGQTIQINSHRADIPAHSLAILDWRQQYFSNPHKTLGCSATVFEGLGDWGKLSASLPAAKIAASRDSP